MLTPSSTTLESWTTVKDAVLWSGANAEVWKRAAAALGDPDLNNLLVLAGVADDDYRRAVDGMEPPVTMLQKSSLNLTFNAVKAKMGVPTLISQALASAPQGPAVVPSQASSSAENMALATLHTAPPTHAPRIKS